MITYTIRQFKHLMIGWLLALSLTAWAQGSTAQFDANLQSKAKSGRSIELTPIYGYALNGHVNLYRAKFKMENAAQFGGIVSVELMPGTMAEFTYTHSATDALYEDFVNAENRIYDLNIDYFQLGVLKELRNAKLVPFGMAAMGVAWYNMQTADVSDHVSFAVSFGGGIKYFFSDRVGIRLQGRLLLPMYFSGGGLFLGIGSGGPSSGVSVSTGVLAVQGDFSGGLIVRF